MVGLVSDCTDPVASPPSLPHLLRSQRPEDTGRRIYQPWARTTVVEVSLGGSELGPQPHGSQCLSCLGPSCSWIGPDGRRLRGGGELRRPVDVGSTDASEGVGGGGDRISGFDFCVGFIFFFLFLGGQHKQPYAKKGFRVRMHHRMKKSLFSLTSLGEK